MEIFKPKYGAPGWNRTSDLQLRRLTPYPLGYGRIKTIKSCHYLIKITAMRPIWIGQDCLKESKILTKNEIGLII